MRVNRGKTWYLGTLTFPSFASWSVILSVTFLARRSFEGHLKVILKEAICNIFHHHFFLDGQFPHLVRLFSWLWSQQLEPKSKGFAEVSDVAQRDQLQRPELRTDRALAWRPGIAAGHAEVGTTGWDQCLGCLGWVGMGWVGCGELCLWSLVWSVWKWFVVISILRKPAECLGCRVCIRRSYGEANLGVWGGLRKWSLLEGGGRNWVGERAKERGVRCTTITGVAYQGCYSKSASLRVSY